MSTDIRILFLADSHLGLDLPLRPRVERRRRGHDFLANYVAAIAPALAGEVDAVVHGGDVFDRSRVAESVAWRAFEPLRRVADRGMPVIIVPGNHERSRLPHLRLALHPRVHVFDRPRTFSFEIRGTRVEVSGFPYERRGVRRRFPDLLERTGWRSTEADVRLLCLHHCVEGATVGPGDYTFTVAEDVIRLRDVPAEFAAVLSGHIHRHQVLTVDLQRRALRTPVLYPGSIERTSLAEIGETKGYLMLRLQPGCPVTAAHWQFRPLPARPMIRREVDAHGLSARRLDAALRALVAAAPRDAVLWVRVSGPLTGAHLRCMSLVHLRTYVPATMNLEVRPADGAYGRPRTRPRNAAPRAEGADAPRRPADPGSGGVERDSGRGRAPAGQASQLEVVFE